MGRMTHCRKLRRCQSCTCWAPVRRARYDPRGVCCPFRSKSVSSSRKTRRKATADMIVHSQNAHRYDTSATMNEVSNGPRYGLSIMKNSIQFMTLRCSWKKNMSFTHRRAAPCPTLQKRPLIIRAARYELKLVAAADQAHVPTITA